MKIVPSIRSLVSVRFLGALACILFAMPLPTQTVESATQSLLEKAHTFEIRGRMDMAAQTWQQVLLVDPNNVDALAGLARSANSSRNPALAKIYLDRIRAINPNDRNIGHVESMGSQTSQTAQPQQARKYAQALRSPPKPTVTRSPQPPAEIAENATTRSRNPEEQRAYSALNAKNLPEAELLFKAILTRDPQNARALAGMGYVRMQQSNFAGAMSFFAQATQSGSHDSSLDAALESARFSSLMADGSTALIANDLTTAEQRYRSALAMHPANPEALSGLGESLLKARQSEAAIAVYERYVQTKPTAPDAWRGLFVAQVDAGHAAQALQTLNRIPAAVHAELTRDPSFQIKVAAMYQSENKLDLAQDILEKLASQQTTAGQKPSSAVQLQLAGIYLARNQPQQAFPIYRRILSENADQPDAWKGLLTALHATGRDGEALAQIQQVPPAARMQLENDVEYLQTLAAIYSDLGLSREALSSLNRVQERYAVTHTAAPVVTDIQVAQLLVGSDNDAELYHQLLLLGDRRDLGDEQRRTIQMIWTKWAVRRASQWATAGNTESSLAILKATALSFPDNPAVPRALADGYLRAGLPKHAVLIFKSQNMTAASVSDYETAVGAALAARDNEDGETWLRNGLAAYPKDTEMLNVAAKYEQGRGNKKRAAEYYRASLAAQSPRDPDVELAHKLSQPLPLLPPPVAKKPRDLATLLDNIDTPEVAPQSKPAPLFLPSYSNVYGQAPVQVLLQPSSTNVIP
jgi:tetratricopeptide (TPR) repeat protein